MLGAGIPPVLTPGTGDGIGMVDVLILAALAVVSVVYVIAMRRVASKTKQPRPAREAEERKAA